MSKPVIDGDGYGKICACCGTPFRTQQRIQKYCSDECIKAMHSVQANSSNKRARARKKK